MLCLCCVVHVIVCLHRTVHQHTLLCKLHEACACIISLSNTAHLPFRHSPHPTNAPPPEAVFSLASIKTSIETAVAAAAAKPDDERKRHIRQLQLRWHPGDLGGWYVFFWVGAEA